MPQTLNREVFITVTRPGPGSTRTPRVPRTPEPRQSAPIAECAIDTAKSGAAILRRVVNGPETALPSRRDRSRAVSRRTRSTTLDVATTQTASTGGAIAFGGTDAPLPFPKSTDTIGARNRRAHFARSHPILRTRDCATIATKVPPKPRARDILEILGARTPNRSEARTNHCLTTQAPRP